MSVVHSPFGPAAQAALALLAGLVIAHVSGKMGALVGADLLNLARAAGLGAPVTSIGSAGIFITGPASSPSRS